MTTFKCRHVRPTSTSYALVEANSAEDAANEFHLQCPKGVRLRDGTGARFSIVEVEGSGKYISRIFVSGIGRRGGVKPPFRENEVDDVVKLAALLEVPIDDLLCGEWAGESEVGIALASITKPKWLD